MSAATVKEGEHEAGVKKRIMDHMNKSHKAELEHLLQAFSGLSTAQSSQPELADLSLESMTIRSASETHEVAITPPMRHLGESRERMVEMSRTALARLGLSDVKIETYSPPVGVDLVILCGVVLYFFCALTRRWVVPGTAAFAILDALFPYGAAGYHWLVKALFVPVILIHVTEAWWMARTRLKHRVEPWTRVYILWIVSTFVEGVMAFKRFDKLVASVKESSKH